MVKTQDRKYDGNSIVCGNIEKDGKAEQQRQKEIGNCGPLCGVEVPYLNFGDLEKESSKQHILSINNTSQVSCQLHSFILFSYK